MGYPIFFARLNISGSSADTGPSEPGTTGTFAFFISLLAAILSPIFSIELILGPINDIPQLSQTSAKYVFSDKKPYPG